MNKIKTKYKHITTAWLLLVLGLISTGVVAQQKVKLPVPNQQQLAWQQAELGVVFHYDLHVFDGKPYDQAYNRSTPVPDYNIFNPGQLDVEQWVLAAKAAGARFALLTATHETGFALWPSDVNPYSVKALKWRDGKADIVQEFVDACRKHGLEPGIYLGIRWNSFLGVHDFKVDGEGEMQQRRQKYYNKMVEGMVEEICTRYGPLFEIWFDGGASSPEKGAPDVLPIVKKYQPSALFYHNDELAEARWGGSESGTVGYPNWSTFPYVSTGAGENLKADGFALLKHGDPNGTYWMPAMADAPLRGYNGRHEWFWEPGDEKHIYPVKDLVGMYYQSVGHNATLILGLTPDTSGLLPAPDVQRLQEFGAEIKRRFEKPLAQTKGTGKNLLLTLPKAQLVNQLVLQENIAKGHRVQRFRVQAQVNGKWQTIASGTAIGQKYIHVLDEPIMTKKLRLQVEEAVAEPDITNFAVFKIKPTTQ